MKYKVKAKVWLWVGASGSTKGSWHFVTIPPEVSEKIEKKYKNVHGGWGSLPVKVLFRTSPSLKGRAGEGIILETSMFKNKRDKNCLTYILPLKKNIRQEVGIQDGDVVDFTLEIKI
jgi:hypothetical protein